MGFVMTKDPDATLDYSLDWSAWLGDDKIATSQWIVEPISATRPLTVAGSSKTDKTATVWVYGGEYGVTYKVTNRITTTGGRTDDRTIIIRVLDR